MVMNHKPSNMKVIIVIAIFLVGCIKFNEGKLEIFFLM